MKGTRFLWLTAILASLSACDTRDDYFLEHGEEPVVDMTTTNDTMNSEYWDGKRYRIVEVGFGKSDTLAFSINDAYGKELSYEFKMQNFPDDNERNGVYAEELMYFFGKDALINGCMATSLESRRSPLDLGTCSEEDYKLDNPCLKKNISSGKITFSLRSTAHRSIAEDYLDQVLRNSGAEMYLSDPSYSFAAKTSLLHEIPFSKEVSARYTLNVKNKIGVETTEYVIVKVKPNNQPVPKISATCVNRETNEYKITVDGSDPDGHDVVKWSYLFDVEPYKIGKNNLQIIYHVGDHGYPSDLLDGYLYYDCLKSAYVNDVNEKECFYWFTFGMEKEDVVRNFKEKDVDFIEPTSATEIYHVFQTKGEHTISVRCKDEYGLWSDYKTEKIYIE